MHFQSRKNDEEINKIFFHFSLQSICNECVLSGVVLFLSFYYNSRFFFLLRIITIINKISCFLCLQLRVL